jgi:ferredoxin-NADP reductase
LKRIGAASGGASTFNVYMGLDCPCTDLGLRNHETFVNTIYDLDKHYEIMRTALNVEPAETAVTAYNAVDPDFSPPGTASVVLTLISYSEPWLKLSPAEYIEAKSKVADNVIKLAERVAPGLRDHIEVVEVATPLTNARYTGNIGGSIIGFDETFKGTGMDRMPSRGALPGLYFTGSYVNIGGGYEPSMVSGFMAARNVLEDMERGGRDEAQMERIQKRLEKQAPDAFELVEDTVLPMKEALRRLHPKRVSLEVSEIVKVTETTETIRVEPARGELPFFRAGQYVNLFVDVDGVLTSRPYSISSPPGKPYWDFTVRRMRDGFVSNYLLDRVKVGDVLESTGPAGSFYHEPLMDTDDLVFLAGGSGITPFASIIKDAAEKKAPFKVHLIYGSRDLSDIIYERELTELSGKHPSFNVDFVISEPPEEWPGLCGLLDTQMISRLVGSVEGKTFYVCGPSPMYPLCEGALESLGVPARRIRKEVYGPPADVVKEPGWPGMDPETIFKVAEERSGRAIEAKAGEPLMNSLEREGIVVPAICRAGECTACRTRLLEGRVFAPERVRLRWSDERAGYIHPCMSYPLEDLRIRI